MMYGMPLGMRLLAGEFIAVFLAVLRCGLGWNAGVSAATIDAGGSYSPADRFGARPAQA
jgi:hypothetical protein